MVLSSLCLPLQVQRLGPKFADTPDNTKYLYTTEVGEVPEYGGDLSELLETISRFFA
jgi:hypothetical protein